MKFVHPLSEAEQKTLHDAYNYAPHPGFRRRAHAILLSAKGYSVNQISDILATHRETVSIWLTRWDTQGLCSLREHARAGRPPIYDENQRERLKALVMENPRQIKAAIAKLTEETGKTACPETAKRALKK
jgi:transposase